GNRCQDRRWNRRQTIPPSNSCTSFAHVASRRLPSIADGALRRHPPWILQRAEVSILAGDSGETVELRPGLRRPAALKGPDQHGTPRRVPLNQSHGGIYM